jgi:exosortase
MIEGTPAAGARISEPNPSTLDRLALIALLPSGLAMLWLIWKARWFWSNDPELEFGGIVVFLCAFLFWEAWDKRPSPQFQWSSVSVLAALFGFALLLLTQLYQAALGVTPASMSGLGVGVLCVVAANLMFVFGFAGIREFGFAAAFVLLSLPMPSVLHAAVVGQLQLNITMANVELLKLFGVPAQQLGTLVVLPNCTVGVDEACSGIRSLQSTLMATLFLGRICLRRKTTAAALLILGVALAIGGNLARSFFLTLVATNQGIAALGQYHDLAGRSVLVVVTGGVVFFAWLLSKLERRVESRAAAQSTVSLEK